MMPKLDGFGLIRELRADPVLATVGDAELGRYGSDRLRPDHLVELRTGDTSYVSHLRRLARPNQRQRQRLRDSALTFSSRSRAALALLRKYREFCGEEHEKAVARERAKRCAPSLPVA
jgi:hypothetical protein